MPQRVLEKHVKQKVVAILKEVNAYYFFPATGGYGRSGVPDVVACFYGLFIGIECKIAGNHPTPLQERELRKIQDAKGWSLVINENNLHVLRDALQSIAIMKGADIDIN